MKNGYDDIRAKIAEDPTWFDEYGVPRYCPFTPEEAANIYANACILLEIECQNCGTSFQVMMSESLMSLYTDSVKYLAIAKKEQTDESLKAEMASLRLENRVPRGAIHYGDPPNTGCCPAGASMNSVPVRVLEFWRQERKTEGERGWPEWQRVPELEIEISAPWERNEAAEPDAASVPEHV